MGKLLKFFDPKNFVQEPNSIYIYGEIGGWGYYAEDFIRDLAEIKSNDVAVHIFSYGGSVTHGMAIYTAAKNSTKNITMHIDGMALSIASIIALGGNRLVMPDNALWMMHEPLLSSFGRADDMRKAAEILDKIIGQMATIYSEKSGKDIDEIKSLMKAETWYTGSEAVEEGFADETSESIELEDSAAAKFDMSAYNFKDMSKFQNSVFKNKIEYPLKAKITNQNPQPKGRGSIMDLAELKAKHPEILAALTAEIKTVVMAELSAETPEELIAKGATAERDRIAGIQSLPAVDGAAEIITAALADPKATKASVSLLIVEAQAVAREKQKTNRDADGNIIENKDGELDNNAGSDDAEGKAAEQQLSDAAATSAAESTFPAGHKK